MSQVIRRKKGRRIQVDDRAETKAIVTKLYESSRVIVEEFLQDGLREGFNDIPTHIWYNALSSICSLAFRIPEITKNERLQEAVVYQVMLMVIQNDVPVDTATKDAILAAYTNIGPMIIDALIPGEKGHCCSLV